MGETALGVLGLAGLFKTALEFWDIVDAGRGYAQDFSYLRGRLDSQRAMFLIWAERMGFESAAGYNKELDHHLLVGPLKSNFALLRLLFSDTDKLRESYGLEVYKEPSVSDAIGAVATLLSSLAISGDQNQAAFRRRYVQFLHNVAKQHETNPSPEATRKTIRQQQKDASIWRVGKWAIRDQKKFKQLVSDVKDIVQDLKGLTEHIQVHKTTEAVAAEFVAQVNEDDLHMVEQVAADNATVLSSAASVRLHNIETRTVSGRSLRSGNATFTTAKENQSDPDPPEPIVEPPETVGKLNFEDLVAENLAACSSLAEMLGPQITLERTPGNWKMARRVKEVERAARESGPQWCTFKPILEDSLDLFLGTFLGPKDTPYEGGIFHVRINLGEKYPNTAPSTWFLTKVLHPNIDARGGICVDLLQEAWQPTYTVGMLLVAVASLLDTPNWEDVAPDSPAAAYVQDKGAFETEAKRWTELYATGWIVNPGEREDGFWNSTDPGPGGLARRSG
ncbi:hypothetical protein G7046_g8639 [Stylonectria norvegica]|nr:hypothetical protein G7046_g8639 [Stylonectria norvegica]